MGGGASKAHQNLGNVIIQFKCKYIGSVPVKVSMGVEVATSAMNRILGMKRAEISIQLVVTDSGVVMLDKNGDTIKSAAINTVSFVQQHKSKNNLVCYLEDDAQNHMVLCHMFRFPSDAIVFAAAIQDAFEANANLDEDEDDTFDSRLVFEEGSAPPVTRNRTMSSASMLSVGPGGKKRSSSTIKKDLKRRSSVDGGVVVAPSIVPEEERRVVEGVYLGSTIVPSAKGDAMCQNAVKMILEGGNEKKQCIFKIYRNAIELSESMGFEANPIHVFSVGNITFAKYFEDKDLFCYVMRDNIRNTLVAHLLGVPKQKEGEISLRREIDKAIKDTKAVLEAEAGPEAIERRHTVEAIFLGSIGVPHFNNPTEVCSTAYKLAKQQGIVDLVFLQVFAAGIRIFDALTSEAQFSMAGSELIYANVFGPQSDIFAFVQHSTKLNGKFVFLFQCTDKMRASQVLDSFATTFGNKVKSAPTKGSVRMGDNAKKEDKNNPFVGEGPRIAAPGNLFKRQIHRADLKAIKVIGAGQFGQVYIATKRNRQTQELETVAVKTLKDVKSAADREEFVHEAEVMLETNHKNLLGLIGVAVQQKPWLMVLDCMDFGDLRGVLEMASQKGLTFTHKELLLITKECAHGMAYMEQIGFCHCDLAARNVLVGKQNSFKIADFGMCRRLRQRAHWNGPKLMKVPIRWSALEVLEDRIFSIKSDVWAFGILAWEIYAYGAMPYPGMNNSQVHRLLVGGGRMKAPPGTPKNAFGAIKGCWKEAPQSRPMFKELKADFDLFFRNNNDGPPRAIGEAVAQETKKTKTSKNKKSSNDNGDYYYSSEIHGMKKRQSKAISV